MNNDDKIDIVILWVDGSDPDWIKEFNKWREKERKTELPPVYQPLMLNCDFLVGLANELGITDSEKTKLDNMLHQS